MSASLGDGAATAFALLHGARNGILTIARGTLPLAIFGPKNYGYRLGLIGAPSRICQALAPLAFGLLIEPVGRGVVVVSAGLSLSALIALMLLPHPRPETVEEFVGARLGGKASNDDDWRTRAFPGPSGFTCYPQPQDALYGAPTSRESAGRGFYGIDPPILAVRADRNTALVIVTSFVDGL